MADPETEPRFSDSKSHLLSAMLGRIPQKNTLGHKEAVRCKDVVMVKAIESKARSLKVWVVKRSWVVIGRTFLLLLFQIKNHFKYVGQGKEGPGMKKDGARSQKWGEKGHGIKNTFGGCVMAHHFDSEEAEEILSWRKESMRKTPPLGADMVRSSIRLRGVTCRTEPLRRQEKGEQSCYGCSLDDLLLPDGLPSMSPGVGDDSETS